MNIKILIEKVSYFLKVVYGAFLFLALISVMYYGFSILQIILGVYLDVTN